VNRATGRGGPPYDDAGYAASAGRGRRSGGYPAPGAGPGAAPPDGAGYAGPGRAGNGQVAQDLRDRLGVRGGPNGASPNGPGPNGAGPNGAGRHGGGRNGTGYPGARDDLGYEGGAAGRGTGRGRRSGYQDADGYAEAGTATVATGRGRTRDRSAPGGAPSWDDPPARGRGGRRAAGPGGPGGPGGGRGGGAGRSGGGRRGFKEWFLSGTWWKRWTWKKALAVLGGAVILVVVIGAVAFMILYGSTTIPSATTVNESAAPSQVYFSNGKPMGTFALSSGPNRLILQGYQIAPVMKNAIVAAEDRNFYHEGGVSLTGILRAAYEDVKGNSYAQGGSTLTEQLVKNYYAGFESDNSDKAAGDKFREIMVAIKLAHTKSKSWIMTQYLNTVYFGDNSYGIGAAAQNYFNEPASKLSVSQSAMLAAMVNQPSYFSPDPKEKAAYLALLARYQYVLGGMVKDGAITQATASQLQSKLPTLHQHLNSALTGYRGYLMQMVDQELTSTYGYTQDQLDTGGLKITTTFSPALERGLYHAVAEEKHQMRVDSQLEGGIPFPPYAYIGSVLEQPSTGKILAVYGGPGYTSNQKKCQREDCYYNMAENPKQVGSSFKPYVLATAVSEQMDVQDSILNGFSPLWIPEGQTQADELSLSLRAQPVAPTQPYLPFNEPSENSGALAVQKAAAISSDPAFEDLAHRDGVQNVINMTKKFGVGQTPFTEGGVNDWKALNAQFGINSKRDTAGSVAIALGEGDLTAVEQASTFATLADGGIYHSPHVVAKIVRAGSVVPLKVRTYPVLTQAQAADTDYALEADNSTSYGTAYPDAAWPGRQVIGKTGTTQTAQDAWFLGAVPQYSMSVALFTYEQDSSTGPNSQTLDHLPDLPNNTTGGYGGAWPAKIWDTFMLNEFTNLPVVDFPTPDYTGMVKWNQVGVMPKKVKKTKPNPSPSTSTTPTPNPSCTPFPGHPCGPGGSTSPSPSPSISTTPPGTTPTPSCTPGFGCHSTTPGTQSYDVGLTAESGTSASATEPSALRDVLAILGGWL
jgi:membrane peptidoglycan carboxypeptidase